MKNFILIFLFISVGVSLKAQFSYEICNTGNSEYQLFQKNEAGNLNCAEEGNQVIISLDGTNSAVRKILDSKEDDLLTIVEIEKTLNLTNIFRKDNISVLNIESTDGLGVYRVYCQFKGQKGYLVYSVVAILKK